MSIWSVERSYQNWLPPDRSSVTLADLDQSFLRQAAGRSAVSSSAGVMFKEIAPAFLHAGALPSELAR